MSDGKSEVGRNLKDVIHEHAEIIRDEQGRKRKVTPERVVREFVLKLIDELAGKTCAEHIKEIHGLREDLAEAEEAARKGEADRARAADLEARLAAAEAREDALRLELEGLRKQLSGEDARTKEELRKLILGLEARVFELEMTLDYFDLETEVQAAATASRAEGVLGRLEAEARRPLAASVRAAVGDAEAAAKRFDALRGVMEDGKGSIGVVVDLVKAGKDFDSARARIDLAGEAAS
jgi:chromosome segregation ATPase